jgi:ABC-type thiamine transport system substrate-binding protein
MDEKAAVSEASKVCFACKFPLDSYYIPRNVAGILTTTKQRALAEEFLKLLTAPDTIKLMYETRLRNDQNLPPEAGPWGPEQEASPKVKANPA